MITTPKVSVIIPTYNSAEYLPAAIESVLTQSCQDYEIIVVNDGSTDNTYGVIARYSAHLRYINQENRGLSGARNTGIQHAQGDYLAFLDADDLFLPYKLSLQTSFLDKHEGVDVVYSNGYLFRPNVHGVERQRLFSEAGLLNTSLGTPSESLPVLVIENAFPVHAAMVRRQAVQAIGGFDEKLSTLADWDFWYRIAVNHHFAYVDEIAVRYRDVVTSMSKDRRRTKMDLERLERKIETSQAFSALPRDIQSRAYFSWGVLDLEYGEPHTALRQFKQALQCNPTNLYARSACWATQLMGQKAVIFYHLKRSLFGLRRLPGS